MRRISYLVLTLSILAVTLTAQDDAEFQGWMKTAGATAGSLHKNLEAKDAAAAAADAKTLEGVFSQVQGYWAKKDVADAAKLSMTASEGFKTVAEEAAASKFGEAEATMKKTSSTCGGCHSVHREKAADGSFKIK